MVFINLEEIQDTKYSNVIQIYIWKLRYQTSLSKSFFGKKDKKLGKKF